jgi:LmbE family N-acetylglucosaminyl deacetylase
MKVLVIAAHPDDEVLGCGASMARHAAAGDEVHIVILAEGITSRGKGGAKRALSRLGQAARKAAAILGARAPVLEAFPDNRMDSVRLLDVVKVVEGHVARIAPKVIYTHHPSDLNVDHGVVHRAVLTACRPLPGSRVERILCFEVPSSTEWQAPVAGAVFAPNWFVDVSRTLPLKLKALGAYASEMRPFPHPRSIEAVEHLAHWRGATAGFKAAEAFVLARAIQTA